MGLGRNLVRKSLRLKRYFGGWNLGCHLKDVRISGISAEQLEKWRRGNKVKFLSSDLVS